MCVGLGPIICRGVTISLRHTVRCCAAKMGLFFQEIPFREKIMMGLFLNIYVFVAKSQKMPVPFLSDHKLGLNMALFLGNFTPDSV